MSNHNMSGEIPPKGTVLTGVSTHQITQKNQKNQDNSTTGLQDAAAPATPEHGHSLPVDEEAGGFVPAFQLVTNKKKDKPKQKQKQKQLDAFRRPPASVTTSASADEADQQIADEQKARPRKAWSGRLARAWTAGHEAGLEAAQAYIEEDRRQRSRDQQDTIRAQGTRLGQMDAFVKKCNAEKDACISEKVDQIAAMSAYAAKVRADLQTTIATKDTQLGSMGLQFTTKDACISAKDDVIAELQAQRKEMDTFLAAKDEVIAELQAERKEMKGQLKGIIKRHNQVSTSQRGSINLHTQRVREALSRVGIQLPSDLDQLALPLLSPEIPPVQDPTPPQVEQGGGEEEARRRTDQRGQRGRRGHRGRGQ